MIKIGNKTEIRSRGTGDRGLETDRGIETGIRNGPGNGSRHRRAGLVLILGLLVIGPRVEDRID